MTVAELKKLLTDYPDDALVVLQKDAEGNEYSPLSSHWLGAYVPDSTWSGEVFLLELTPELVAKGYGEEDTSSDGTPALILGPVN